MKLDSEEEVEEAGQWIEKVEYEYFGVEDIVNEYLLNWTINKNREIEDKNTEKRTLLKETTEEKDKIKIGMRKEKEMAKFTTNYDAIYRMIEHPKEESKN